jgi:putative membrane protein
MTTDFWETWLPLFNATLIGVSGIFLLTGFYFIRRKQVEYHRRCMLTATVFAALFLVVYVTRALLFETKLFAGEGIIRAAYLGILGSHMVLAVVVGPLVLATITLALRRNFRLHRRLARITLPMWLYVVATGWIIYLMLHHLA